MSESFESVMAFALKTTSTECMSEDMREWCYSTDGCQDCTAKLLNRLQRAHEHEIEHIRKEVAARYELTHCPACEARLNGLDVQHDIEHIRKAAYHRGYVAGQRSMDADHEAVAMRLRGLRFDGGSHENLNKIAYAIYPCATGWTCESCEGLRDKIIDLLGGVHERGADCGGCGTGCDCSDSSGGEQEAVDVDDSVSDVCADVPASDGVADSATVQVTYDVLGNERHKAVCGLRQIVDDGEPISMLEFAYAIDANLNVGKRVSIATRDRLIHLLGGDEPTAMEYIKRIVREHDIQCSDMEPSGAELSQASVDAMDKRAFIESLVKRTEELSRQGKVKFPPNADGSLDSLKTVEETAALIEEVRRRAYQSHESSPMRQENETGISDRTDEPNFTKIAKTINSGGKHDSELMENGENHKIATITDELRKWASDNTIKDMVLTTYPEQHGVHGILEQLIAIADRIDEQFNRICWQQEAVLQQTINDLIDERNKLQRELSEQKSCAEGFAQTAQAKWYEEQVLKLERELVEVRGAVDRARDGWAKTDEEKRELQEERDELRRNAEHEADKCKECREMFERYRDAYVKYVGKYNNAVKQHDELQAECDRLTAALDELHADPANDAICRLERERDDLLELLKDAVTEYQLSQNGWAYGAVVSETITLESENNELRAKLEEADAAIANYREREKSFAESERMREELQAKLDVIRGAMDE